VTEGKSIRNQERGSRTAENHGETEATEKSRKQSQAQSSAPGQWRKGIEEAENSVTR
jgi:hypothetical protein